MAGFVEYLTEEGSRMLAKMASGKKIAFTKMMLGDGELSSGQEQRNVTDLISPKVTLDIESVIVSSQNSVVITANLSNDKITESFYYREKGIYMTDGTTEVLGIYGNNGKDGELIEPIASSFNKKKLKTIIVMSSSQNINIEIKTGEYSPAPVIPDNEVSSFEDFVNTQEASNMVPGRSVIINNIEYTFLGGDPTDMSNYADSSKAEIIKEREALLQNTEYGKVADAIIVRDLYKNALKLNKLNEYVASETVFIDENTIKTTYADGKTVVTVLEEDTITTTYYNADKEVLKIRTAKINDTGISESEEVMQEDDTDTLVTN